MKKEKKIISSLLYHLLIILGSFTENKFISNTKKASMINENVLFDILKTNKATVIGKEYDFSSIKMVDEFKDKFPLTDYSFYEKYIDEIKEGKSNILTKDTIEYLGHTSGTTGNQKLIPVTRKSRLIASKYMAFLIQKITYNNYKNEYKFCKGVLLTDMAATPSKDSKIPICSATSGGMKKMSHVIPYLYSSPIEVMYIADKTTQLYLHALFALSCKDLMYLSGVFVSSVLDFFRVIENNHKSLVNDIRKGKINTKIAIDSNLRKKLNSYLSPNAALADNLEKEFKCGFKSISKRLWPNLFIIISVSGANFSIYEKQLNYYTDQLPIYSPSLASTECFIGINPYKDEIRYVITPDTAFFEFINIKDADKKNPVTYTLNNVKKDEIYEIVLTNYAGLYRYKLGDVVKVSNFYNKSPKLEFLYRKNQLLNMVSEKTTENHIKCALNSFSKKENLNIVDYTTFADNSVTPGHYTLFIEFTKNRVFDENYINKIEKSLDKELMICNPAYKRFRKKNQLSCLKIKIVKTSSFNCVKELMIKNGTSKNQLKIPRVINNSKESLLKSSVSYKIYTLLCERTI